MKAKESTFQQPSISAEILENDFEQPEVIASFFG